MITNLWLCVTIQPVPRCGIVCHKRNATDLPHCDLERIGTLL